MLSRLYIRNIALIQQADIEFDKGLNVLSGETGSGKSVILDSINFVLGSKADRTMIRYGEQEASVRAEFVADKNSVAVKKLNDYDIESDGEIIITRKLSSDGKNSIKINGNTVTAAMLKNVTQHLVDVHGQSEHFYLLDEDNQLKVIDGLLGEQGVSIKCALSDAISQKNEIKKKIAVLGGDEAERARKLDLLEYQIDEINKADIRPGEFDELKNRQNIINNVEKLLSSVNGVINLINEDSGCGDRLSSAVHALNQISNIDGEYEKIAARLDGLNAELSDVASTLSDMAENLTFDEQEAKHIEERLDILKILRKKYGVDEEEILTFKDKAQEEYNLLFDSGEILNKCKNEIEKLDKEIFELCLKLTSLRKNAAEKLAACVIDELKTLNIPDACFAVKFNEYNFENANLHSINGSDIVCFEFSANKGEPMKPMSKVISGGEMSRFMLAMKTQLKDLNDISTYIFDEIDAGISGYTADKVARKFTDIAGHTQILAVSHLAQICAASDAQYYIYKSEEGGKTLTRVKKLNDKEKIEEIIRLTGSLKSDAAVKHAEELISSFKNN